MVHSHLTKIGDTSPYEVGVPHFMSATSQTALWFAICCSIASKKDKRSWFSWGQSPITVSKGGFHQAKVLEKCSVLWVATTKPGNELWNIIADSLTNYICLSIGSCPRSHVSLAIRNTLPVLWCSAHPPYSSDFAPSLITVCFFPSKIPFCQNKFDSLNGIKNYLDQDFTTQVSKAFREN